MLKVRRSAIYTSFFSSYSQRQFQKHFTAVRTLGLEPLEKMELTTPIIFYINHAYWWDGFWSQLLTERYFKQNLYIIIEYKQLVLYPFFTRLGAFSIVRENPREAIESIHYAVEKLAEHSDKQNALWVFPQGAIEPIDKRPLKFYSGAAKIAKQLLDKVPQIYLCSVATRIEYQNEQKPELFISFKKLELLTSQTFTDVKTLTSEMQSQTEIHLDELKSLIMEKDLSKFELFIEGKLSVNRRWDKFKKQLWR
jgi:chlorobactene lauroyltransferase